MVSAAIARDDAHEILLTNPKGGTMPVLHKYKDKDEHYVLTSIKGSIVTFQLTREGYLKLQGAGIAVGQRFGRFLLLDLYRSADAYTRGTVVEVRGVQGKLDFSRDPEPETMFPSCAECSSHSDLHLVEIRDQRHYASILCTDCRTKRSGLIQVSIPLPLVTKALLNKFLAIRSVDETDKSVSDYRDLLYQEFAKKWEALAASKKPKPIQLRLGDDKKPDRLI
jgi:hypothetical protein